MTCEELYEPAVTSYIREWGTFLLRFQYGDITNMSAGQLHTEVASRKRMLRQLEETTPPDFTFDISAAIDKTFASKRAQHEKLIEDAKRNAEAKRERRRAEQREKERAATEAAESSINVLVEKQRRLQDYQDKIAEATLHYGINPSELELDVDSMSREEIEVLLDTALDACKYLGDSKLRTKLLEWCAPVEGVPRSYTVICVLLAITVASPLVLVALFSYMFWNTAHVYRQVEGLRIADKLMYHVNLSKYATVPADKRVGTLDFSDIDSELEEQLAELERNSPENEITALQDDINLKYEQISDAYETATSTVRQKYEKALVDCRVKLEEAEAALKAALSEIKPFGSVQCPSFVMNRNYTLGASKGVFDVTYPQPIQNVLFLDKSKEMLQFMKLMFSNAILSVRPRQLKCTVYDPEGLGAEFATFMSQDTQDYINVVTDEFETHLKGLRAYSQNNLRILDQLDIDTYNREAEALGKITLEYRLFVVLSGVDKIQENKNLSEFLQFSARTGVMFWIVSPTPVNGCVVYAKPFQGIEEPYPVTSAVFTRTMRTYVEAMTTMKDGGIHYKSSFADKYIPEKDWWSEHTDKGIKLNIGLQDGDPEKGYAIELGDGNVHGLCVGTTGAGKSVFNNQLIVSLITRYAPEALELILVDFKNVEFSALTNPTTHISRIPHARIIAGTKDGEYAISIFNYLIDEMERRTALFNELGLKDIKSYNKTQRTKGTPENCLPRVLLIIDEFQVMFTEVDPKSVDVIQDRIRSLAKLARFCGCHMLFTSQSMKGTMPKDILDQFTLRLALRCSSDASNDILGSDAAAKIKSKYGYIYSNTSGGETQDTTRLWRTPNIETDLLNEYLDKVEAKCAEVGSLHHRAYFYNESELVTSDDMSGWVQAHAEVLEKEDRVFVMGARTEFSLKTSPVNFKLQRRDNEHLFLFAFESVDFHNLCMTVINNILADSRATLLLNCADPDTYRILEVEKWYNKDYLELAAPMPDPADWLTFLEELVNARKDKDPSEYGPLYFMAIRWDKQNKLGRDESYTISDRWAALLQEAASVDVHIILCAQDQTSPLVRKLTAYNHLVCARCSEEASYRILDSARASKLPSELGFAIYVYGMETQKFKIYQHTFTQKAESRDLAF